jgi:hypothetical protein
MSKEKMYAVKNDEGEYLDSTPRWNDKAGTAFKSSATTLAWAKIYDGHVVTLIEEPKKVVLTKEEAKMLDKAKTASYPANYISMNAHPDPGANGTSYEELRLMRALVNGYTVAKEKRYLLQMEGFGEHQGYSYMEDGIWYINTAPSQDYAVKHGYTVTKDEYDSAPNWVKILKPVEVTDDEK